MKNTKLNLNSFIVNKNFLITLQKISEKQQKLNSLKFDPLS